MELFFMFIGNELVSFKSINQSMIHILEHIREKTCDI